MRRDPRAFLWDALSAAEAIQGFVQGRDARQYAADALLHSAVERKFEIIGEALGQLAKVDEALAAHVPRLAQIIAFRNVLIHGYAVVNHETVWNVVEDALPELVAALRRLLQEAESP